MAVGEGAGGREGKGRGGQGRQRKYIYRHWSEVKGGKKGQGRGDGKGNDSAQQVRGERKESGTNKVKEVLDNGENGQEGTGRDGKERKRKCKSDGVAGREVGHG